MRMSRPLAPIAMRMPISRVRSVTETSMMFMIPMPPTRSEIDGDRGEEQRQRARGLGRRSAAISCCERIMKSASWPGREPVALAQQRLDLLLRLVHRARGETADAMNMSIFAVRLRAASSPSCRGR